MPNVNSTIEIDHLNYSGNWVVVSVNSVKRTVKVRYESDIESIRIIEVPLKLIKMKTNIR